MIAKRVWVNNGVFDSGVAYRSLGANGGHQGIGRGERFSQEVAGRIFDLEVGAHVPTHAGDVTYLVLFHKVGRSLSHPYLRCWVVVVRLNGLDDGGGGSSVPRAQRHRWVLLKKPVWMVERVNEMKMKKAVTGAAGISMCLDWEVDVGVRAGSDEDEVGWKDRWMMLKGLGLMRKVCLISKPRWIWME